MKWSHLWGVGIKGGFLLSSDMFCWVTYTLEHVLLHVLMCNIYLRTLFFWVDPPSFYHGWTPCVDWSVLFISVTYCFWNCGSLCVCPACVRAGAWIEMPHHSGFLKITFCACMSAWIASWCSLVVYYKRKNGLNTPSRPVNWPLQNPRKAADWSTGCRYYPTHRKRIFSRQIHRLRRTWLVWEGRRVAPRTSGFGQRSSPTNVFGTRETRYDLWRDVWPMSRQVGAYSRAFQRVLWSNPIWYRDRSCPEGHQFYRRAYTPKGVQILIMWWMFLV
jgi:hypothetical protein